MLAWNPNVSPCWRTRGALEKQVWACMRRNGIFIGCTRRSSVRWSEAWAGTVVLPRRRPDGNMVSGQVMPISVSVIGMGKLGAPMVAAMAARGIRAIGVDSDAAKVEAIGRGHPPVFEPRPAETLVPAQGRPTAPPRG